MSAECSTCGHDLAADYPCAYCALEERAEKAERERGDALAAFDDTQEMLAAQIKETDDAERERDELAAALEGVVRAYDADVAVVDPIGRARAVLERVRERTG